MIFRPPGWLRRARTAWVHPFLVATRAPAPEGLIPARVEPMSARPHPSAPVRPAPPRSPELPRARGRVARSLLAKKKPPAQPAEQRTTAARTRRLEMVG